jgi:hypothetical protein
MWSFDCILACSYPLIYRCLWSKDGSITRSIFSYIFSLHFPCQLCCFRTDGMRSFSNERKMCQLAGSNSVPRLGSRCSRAGQSASAHCDWNLGHLCYREAVQLEETNNKENKPMIEDGAAADNVPAAPVKMEEAILKNSGTSGDCSFSVHD